MCLAVYEHNPPRAIFEFYNSYTPNQQPPESTRLMMLSSPQNQLDVGTIDCAAFVSIDSQRFRYVLNLFRNVEKVDVAIMPSKVIFRSPGRTMFLYTEDKQCIIGGIGAGKELGFPISLNPTTFFNDLITIVDRVWLYLTTKLVSVIAAPIDLNVRIETYFIPSTV
ncbi:uncharacterized protein LOC111498892 [Cucurbita maxima]|uniref:Uncharacterized protein LOC111498892 n=1 Tax=Cucurbita maxima TaxID=3661 RepID=A0A6J1KZ10_CUCMA|nr:uncharacterized protein LOC111498892 [Cucurbita maxima]